MSRGVHALPQFLAQSLQLNDVEWRWRLERRGQQAGHLLLDRAPFMPGTGLELLIERVGQVLDVEGGHAWSSITPPFWRNTTESVKRALPRAWRQEGAGRSSREDFDHSKRFNRLDK